MRTEKVTPNLIDCLDKDGIVTVVRDEYVDYEEDELVTLTDGERTREASVTDKSEVEKHIVAQYTVQFELK